MQTLARNIKKTSFAGKGCAIQALGLACPLLGSLLGVPGFILGLIAMMILFIVGSQQSTYFTCSQCGTRLLDKTIRHCPGCHSELD
jgi:hypothetical protein